jgi:carbamoyl-phosphate synthase small subunit
MPEPEKDQFGLSATAESDKVHLRGIVCSEYSQNHSHWRAKKSLSDYLKEAGVPGICGIDTRALTKILRTKGCMLGKIVVADEPAAWYDPNQDNMVSQVSTKKIIHYRAEKPAKKTVVLIDCGIKNNSIRNFLQRGVNIIRVPWNFDFIDPVKKADFPFKFDGVFISNGPGNPALLEPTIKIIKKCLAAGLPVFGICLGNQLMGLAAGARTYKLKFGHRAQNQPCTNTEDGRCYMTSQNHGFAIDRKTLPKNWKIWFEHANDKTIEGIKHESMPFMAVQFHPEAYPGPLDTGFLFDQFIKYL